MYERKGSITIPESVSLKDAVIIGVVSFLGGIAFNLCWILKIYLGAII